MTFTLTAKGKTTPLVVDGWTYIADSLGCFLFNEGHGVYTLYLSNGAVGRDSTVGAFYFDCITLNCPSSVSMALRIGHGFGTDGRLQIGTPNGIAQHYFPAGGAKIVRFALAQGGDQEAVIKAIYDRPIYSRTNPFLCAPSALAGQQAIYDDKANRMFAALRTGAADSSVEMRSVLGVWHPVGDTEPGVQGGGGIDPIPGWDRSARYRILHMDLTAERMPVEYRNANTGAPLLGANQPKYRASRGWGKETTHAEFVKQDPASPNPDARVPVAYTTGPCPYVAALNAYMAIDAQHLIRATCDAAVAWFRHRDRAAFELLRMWAADAWMGLASPIAHAASAAGGDYGRAYAWTHLALLYAGYEDKAALLSRVARRVQMPNKAWYRAESRDEENLGFSPKWWSGLKVPLNVGAYQTMEGCFVALALALDGDVASADQFFDALLAARPERIPLKVTGVSEDGVPTPTQFGGWGVVESYWLWPLAGVLARTYPSKYTAIMQKMVPPGAGAVAGPNVRAALIAAGNPNASAAALEVLR